MSDIKKIKRAALVVFCFVCASLLFQLAFMAHSMWLWRGWMAAGIASWNVATMIVVYLPTPIMLVSLIISLILLHTIRKESTPFNLRNVKRLKFIAIMLILLEPVLFLSERLFVHFWPPDGRAIGVTIYGGTIIAIGLITYCLALVFQYGIALQNQVDETL